MTNDLFVCGRASTAFAGAITLACKLSTGHACTNVGEIMAMLSLYVTLKEVMEIMNLGIESLLNMSNFYS